MIGIALDWDPKSPSPLRADARNIKTPNSSTPTFPKNTGAHSPILYPPNRSTVTPLHDSGARAVFGVFSGVCFGQPCPGADPNAVTRSWHTCGPWLLRAALFLAAERELAGISSQPPAADTRWEPALRHHPAPPSSSFFSFSLLILLTQMPYPNPPKSLPEPRVS